jgi:NADH-quinone oxidoreductase subunit D
MAVEKLAGIEVPKRAQYIRMLVFELSRIMGHLVSIGTFAMDVGAVTVFMWTFRERENIQNIYDKLAGARFTTSIHELVVLQLISPMKLLIKQENLFLNLIMQLTKLKIF